MTLTGAANAADLIAIDVLFTSLVDASLCTPITVNGADFSTLFANELAGTISLPGNFAAIVVDAATAAQINEVNTQTTGVVNATAVTSIAGTTAEFDILLTANAALPDELDLAADFDAVVTGVATATTISTLRGVTTGQLDGLLLTAINGAIAEVLQALTDLDLDPTGFNSALKIGRASWRERVYI